MIALDDRWELSLLDGGSGGGGGDGGLVRMPDVVGDEMRPDIAPVQSGNALGV